MAVLDAGHRVIGLEGTTTATETFFKENEITYEIEKDQTGQFSIYKVGKYSIDFLLLITRCSFRASIVR